MATELTMAKQFTRHEDRGLELDALQADPIQQFSAWLSDAERSGQMEPTAMTLATADAQGQPSARMVLFKGLLDGAFSFYTNHESRKGQELSENQNVALVFWWDQLERQVRIEGQAQRMPQSQADAYYQSRSRGSRIGAWASRQSQPVAGREALEQRVASYAEQYADKALPIPGYWGGYLVKPVRIEFWQGRANRLHDRFLFTAEAEQWQVVRLEP